uniref:Uncharacterized protein n=1 Tax=Limosilactobacillus reuteri TaxID=1598 RepID=Q9FCV4_LIMRT|nr:hypothetical protein [Lactobacillus reuteri] [Limosilactobacillus reuteri subsp. suis]
MDYLRDVERLTKKRLLPLKPPTEEEAFIGRAAMAEQNVQELVKKTDVDKFGEQADRLLEQYDARTLVAALLNDEIRQTRVRLRLKLPLNAHYHARRAVTIRVAATAAVDAMVVATAIGATVTVVNGTTARTAIVGTGMTATQVQTTGKITTRAVISATL